MQHPNSSEYTLDTVHDTDPLLPADPDSSYGAADYPPPPPSPTRLLLAAALRMAALFVLASLLLGGTLFLALPTLDPCVPSLSPFVSHPPPAKTVPCSTFPNHLMISRRSTAS